MPEVSDEFASTVDTEYESVDQLRGSVRQQLMEREEEIRKNAHEDAVVQAVVDQAKIEIPPQLVEEEAQRILDQLTSSLDRQGITIEQYLRFTQKNEAEFRAELRTQGERSVRRSEVLQAVARAEGLDVSDDELREEIVSAASDEREAKRITDSALAQPQMRERLASVLRQRKAVRYLMETVGGVRNTAAEEAASTEKPGEGTP